MDIAITNLIFTQRYYFSEATITSGWKAGLEVDPTPLRISKQEARKYKEGALGA